MKTLRKKVFQLVVNATNVTYSISRLLELEATIRTVLFLTTNQPQKMFFEVSIGVVAVESISRFEVQLTPFNFATKSSFALLTTLLLLFVQNFVDRTRGSSLGQSQPLVATCWRDFRTDTQLRDVNVLQVYLHLSSENLSDLVIFKAGLNTRDHQI